MRIFPLFQFVLLKTFIIKNFSMIMYSERQVVCVTLFNPLLYMNSSVFRFLFFHRIPLLLLENSKLLLLTHLLIEGFFHGVEGIERGAGVEGVGERRRVEVRRRRRDDGVKGVVRTAAAASARPHSAGSCRVGRRSSARVHHRTARNTCKMGEKKLVNFQSYLTCLV